jgi:hypothetical protein
MVMNAVPSYFMSHCAIYTDDHHSMPNILAFVNGIRLSKSVFLVCAFLKPEFFMFLPVFIWVILLAQFLGPQWWVPNSLAFCYFL